ncbi:uncharacterized protein LOC117167080 isoform X2 [Belonocnema kinseyi]|uniref:uncharacterized protein LOC117167080 isoform X2 n=1 Tax=Belonocnema kinseyi TaxID=2817044 RepID=UPI00143DB49E|nr:uncharacterized protein LOC117167080 isoform X2 [Belonocnema kinseyi]
MRKEIHAKTNFSLRKRDFWKLQQTKMDNLFYKIQVYLQKKDQECGRLQFLTSRTTEESIKHIEDVCTSISGFLGTFKISTKGRNLKDTNDCILVFKYLVLNTAFKSQTYLLEDITNGHLADMCPPLSPYLFLEVLQYIQYEEILAESILYFPLDLCVEILEISRRCFKYAEFDRALNTLIALISNAYKKFLIVKELGSQTSCFEDFTERLVNIIQELISLIFNEKIIRFDEVSNLKKHERYGIILKKILKMVRDLLESRSINLSAEKEKLYKITFGNQSPVSGCEEVMQLFLEELNQELINLLLRKIKEIDCNIYLGWAELNYDNGSISLQRSIGIDCFYFADALKKQDQITKFEHLIKCLDQLASKPNAGTPLSEFHLEELCRKSEGHPEYIKELLKRYKDWNESIFDCIEQNESLLDKDDCLYLLEYLLSIILQSDMEAYKVRVYSFVTKVLLNQSITDLYAITIEYLLNHDGCKILEFSKTIENFKNFITHNTTFLSAKNLRFVLISVIKSPKKILTIILKIVIGHTNYEHVMISPRDVFLLSPILKIQTENGRTLLMNILGECLQNSECNIKKFTHFMQVMEENNYETDEIFNDLFIPYLESESFNVSSINSVLNSVRKMQNKCTENLKIDKMVIAIAKRISCLRKDTSLPKYVNGEILCLLFRVIEVFIRDQSRWFNLEKKIAIISSISVYIEPIDRPYFSSLWHLTKQGIDVRDIMEDYERRCFIVMNEVKNQGVSERLRSCLGDFSFLNEDFLRHLILRSTELEYAKYGTEIVLLNWDIFGWKSELDAFDQFVRITIEACLLCLEFSDVSSPQSFPFLIKCLSRLSKSIFKLNVTKTYESIHNSLTQSIKRLDHHIKNSQYSDFYQNFLTSVNNISCKNSLVEILQQLISAIHYFGCQCLGLVTGKKHNYEYTSEVIKFRIIHEFISNAMKVSAEEAYICITKMEEFLFSEGCNNKKEQKQYIEEVFQAS